MTDNQTAYDELYVYTMGRPKFILQHVVDAHMAQTAADDSKSIGIVFALVGLYLHVEKGFTGAQVQQVHRTLARQKRQWPAITLPADRGNLTARDVMTAPEGAERDAAIDRWCETVWKSFAKSREVIVRLLDEDVVR